MRKTSFNVVSVILISAEMIVGCAPSQISITSIPIPPTPTLAPLPVTIAPFYNSESNQINVGNYSEQLGASDLGDLDTLAQEMSSQKDVLTPEQMFVLAIRLFDLGDSDNAVYWFYEAQFRAKLFQAALDPLIITRVGDPAFELPVAYSAFTQLSGEYINGYAGCDIQNWIRIATMVKDDNREPPDLETLFPGVRFVESSEWQSLNDEVADGLAGLINHLSNNQETIKQQRLVNNADARFCR